MTITYRGDPVSVDTAHHAIQYIRDADEWHEHLGVPMSRGFAEAIARVQFPCRAIGVAREALIRSGWSTVAAIKELEAVK